MPVVQTFDAVRQGLVAVQVLPAWQATHAPFPHTMFWPQTVPFACDSCASRHSIVPVVEQTVRPTWHWLVGVQTTPVIHEDASKPASKPASIGGRSASALLSASLDPPPPPASVKPAAPPPPLDPPERPAAAPPAVPPRLPALGPPWPPATAAPAIPPVPFSPSGPSVRSRRVHPRFVDPKRTEIHPSRLNITHVETRNLYNRADDRRVTFLLHDFNDVSFRLSKLNQGGRACALP